MASKTVWIVGGVVVAIGAIAYLSYNKAPAGKDAAGTIVEAKRARADGTNSFNPTPTASTTEQNASDASKAMAGPDAAKDAAGAASGSGDAVMKGGGSNRGARADMDAKHTAAESADAATAAGAAGGSSANVKNPNLRSGMNTTSSAAEAKAASLAAQGPNSQLRGGEMRGAATNAGEMKSSNPAAVEK